MGKLREGSGGMQSKQRPPDQRISSPAGGLGVCAFSPFINAAAVASPITQEEKKVPLACPFGIEGGLPPLPSTDTFIVVPSVFVLFLPPSFEGQKFSHFEVAFSSSAAAVSFFRRAPPCK